MPVFIEYPQQLSQQDQADLQLIYADLPVAMLSPFADAGQLLATGQASGLVVARFNSRLLGAALLQRQDAQWQLSHLCVRALTRRRGVARRLLDELSRQAGEQGAELHMQIQHAPEWFEPWLTQSFPTLKLQQQ